MNDSKPTVSIILPTYNRAKFLPEAFAAIKGQTWTDWELIVVDDGSSDNTRELVPELTRGWPQPVRYIYQENQGAYGARNTGLDQAKGKYVAFYDSDDLWLPHHLNDCVQALDANPDVDWVWGACRIVNLTTGQEIAPTTFIAHGQPRPFTRLRSLRSGPLQIIDDPGAACCQIEHGLYCGLQNSVIRRRLFESYRFNADLRNEAEDQVIVIWALSSGFRFGYLDKVHVTYHIHESNSSSASQQAPVHKQRRIYEAAIAGFERLAGLNVLGPQEHRALARRLGSEHFWKLGYAIHWMHGERREALAQFRKGLTYSPWNWRYWKTYTSAVLRSMVPVAAKRWWWWATDSKWRHVNRLDQARISSFRNGQRRVIEKILRQHGDRILTGPFRGLRYTPAHRDTFCAQALLGTYEKEICPVVEQICDTPYDTIVDIGAANGYYVCGFASRKENCRIVGFEAQAKLHAVIRELAIANGLENVEIYGVCTAESLAETIEHDGRQLVMCDIEGGEGTVLDPDQVPALLKTDILVETHDLIEPEITRRLIDRFRRSHSISEIKSIERAMCDFPEGIELTEMEAKCAMDEFRGGEQSWLWMQATIAVERNRPVTFSTPTNEFNL